MDLKILIVSTWKTGNTWLKNILEAVYDLPIYYPQKFVYEKIGEDFGPRWVIHQHLRVDPALLEWAKENGVILITTLRHPGDILVSLYYHKFNYPQDYRQTSVISDEHKASLLSFGLDADHLAATEEYVRKYFWQDLKISADWLTSGAAYSVYYEDLLQNTFEVLTKLTSSIQPVEPEKIERVIEQTSLEMLRGVTGRSKFFRKGHTGGWSAELPPSIIQIFKEEEPYPELFEQLGYNLGDSEPFEPQSNPVSGSVPALSPFAAHPRFDNGVLVRPIINRLYLSLEKSVSGAWPDPANTEGDNTFFNWLNKPAGFDPGKDQDLPLITNLAAQIYRFRAEYHHRIPNIFGNFRVIFIYVFIKELYLENNLDYSFVEPMRKSLLRWGNLSSKADTTRQEGQLQLTNLAVSIYEYRTDIQEIYPDIFGKDREAYFLWMIRFPFIENIRLDGEFYLPLLEHFREWSFLSSEKLSPENKDLPPISNLALCFYKSREDYRASFPDIYGKDRVNYVTWLAENSAEEYNLGWDFSSQFRNSLE